MIFIVYRLLWPNGQIPHFLEIFSKNTVSEINGKVSLFLEFEFQKLEFLISSATVALLSWISIEIQFSALCPSKFLIFVAIELLSAKIEKSKIN